MNRKINFARFHQSLHLAGLGEMGNTLPSPQKKILNLKMCESAGGVQVEIGANRFVVPYANVVVYTYEESDGQQA